MTSIINASISSNGIVSTADASGILKVQSNGVTTNALAWGSYLFVANGTIPTKNSAYNISSITRNSTGNYTFAFTTALPDALYSVCSSPQYTATLGLAIGGAYSKSTSSFIVNVGYTGTGPVFTAYDYGIDFVVFGS
jgi:hypothetical protein